MTTNQLRQRMEQVCRRHRLSLAAQEEIARECMEVENLLDGAEDSLEMASKHWDSAHGEGAGEVLEEIREWKDQTQEVRDAVA